MFLMPTFYWCIRFSEKSMNENNITPIKIYFQKREDMLQFALCLGSMLSSTSNNGSKALVAFKI